MQSLAKTQTLFLTDSEEEGIYLYAKMKEAERWERKNLRIGETEEQTILPGRETDNLFKEQPRSSADYGINYIVE